MKQEYVQKTALFIVIGLPPPPPHQLLGVGGGGCSPVFLGYLTRKTVRCAPTAPPIALSQIFPAKLMIFIENPAKNPSLGKIRESVPLLMKFNTVMQLEVAQ